MGKGYISRSFCVLETYAAVYNNVPLRVVQTMSYERAELERVLAPSNPDDGHILRRYWAGPVKSAHSDTRNPDDKKMIDNFIMSLPDGFEGFDAIVTQAILDSANPRGGWD